MATRHAVYATWLAVSLASWMLAAGCGSRTGFLDGTGAVGSGSGSGGSSGGSGGSNSGSGSSSGSIADATTPDAGCDARQIEAEILQRVSPNGNGMGVAEGYVFDRKENLLSFFRALAKKSDPALCAGGTIVNLCPYDPTTLRSGPADIHHSTTLDEFVGPDGQPWIWIYVASRNLWVAADANRSPTTYALLAQYMTCVVEQDGGEEPILDASPPSCPQGQASCGAVQDCLQTLVESARGAPPDGGLPDWVFVFAHEEDCLDYLQMVLQLDAAPGAPPAGSTIVGANGHPYVYGWVQSQNVWFVIDGYNAPAAYQLGLEYEQCTAPDAATD